MSALEQLVRLDDYQTYLKYRRPPGAGYSQVPNKKNVWVPSDEAGYQPGTVVDESDANVTVVQLAKDQSEKIFEKDKVHGMNPVKFDGVEDCAELGYLSDAAVLHNLKLRYDANIIYTYSGLFCVVINPYKLFPIYNQKIIELYNGKRRDELAPHGFAVADEAYRNLLSERQSQSMLVTGESGAGKTENTKKVIQYLAAIAGSKGAEGKLEQQLLQANPLLEALGNAKTTKNNNSSRFGKFIRITFDQHGTISGASIVSYLLEKSRVVNRGQNERSFHIFYQLIAALDAERKKKYGLGAPTDYAYLRVSNCTEVAGMDEKREFASTVNALTVLGFSEDEQDVIFRVVAAILHLGNVEFKGDETAQSPTLTFSSTRLRPCSRSMARLSLRPSSRLVCSPVAIS